MRSWETLFKLFGGYAVDLPSTLDESFCRRQYHNICDFEFQLRDKKFKVCQESSSPVGSDMFPSLTRFGTFVTPP